ncbi:sialidase family protein [Streptomyces albus]
MQRKRLTALAVALLLCTGSAGAASARELPSSTVDLATRGQGYPEYRIPALTTTEDGTLIAAYDARPTLADLPGHIAIVVRRSTDGGATWGPQQVVRSDPAPKGYGDPSLLTDRTTGRVFLFHAASVNQGFAGSATGNDESDPDVLQTDLSYSDDGGVTWRHRRITAMVKDPTWAGTFAASGQGIQLRHGAHRGRLIQQYVVRKDGQNYAASVHSDDHGRTWRTGELVGPGTDENKTVELSDGTVMLNNRAAPHRTVARSTDGGVTYTPLRADTQLPDPGNNGSVVRYAPDAPSGDPRSRWLLFSNTESTTERRNLTVKLSCDDGRTWPVKKVIDSGPAGYSTLTVLPDGRVGLLYERDGYRYLTYTSFGLDEVGGGCPSGTPGR